MVASSCTLVSLTDTHKNLVHTVHLASVLLYEIEINRSVPNPAPRFAQNWLTGSINILYVTILMSLPQLKILRTYAKMDDASIAAKKLPPTVYFSHTRHTLTVFDAYPKALFHFLVLPRLLQTTTVTATSTVTGSSNGRSENDGSGEDDDGAGAGAGEGRSDGSDSASSSSLANSEAVLTSLRTLLQRGGLEGAKETLRVLADEATRLRCEIEGEMRARHGFAWPIWVGFHAVPSME